jgi:hypothetical protein
LPNQVKPDVISLMPGYKRNQVEEAISRVLDPRSKIPTTELRTRLKRLLDTDRALGGVQRSNDRDLASYAFYSADAPGSGIEVWFSSYEAFALLNGIRLMGHRWPQGFAVLVMRRIRHNLELEHARILRQDPKELFDLDAIARKAKPGDMAFDVTDPVLLTIVSRSGSTPDAETEPWGCGVARGPTEAMSVWKAAGGTGLVTIFELAAIAHKLEDALKRIEPIQRGRG